MYAYSQHHHHNQDTKHIHHLQKFPCMLLLSFYFAFVFGTNITWNLSSEYFTAHNTVLLTVSALLYRRFLKHTHPHKKKTLCPLKKKSPCNFTVYSHHLKNFYKPNAPHTTTYQWNQNVMRAGHQYFSKISRWLQCKC